MADFTSGGWSIFITVITLVSLVALSILCWMLSGRAGTSSVETSGHVWDEDLEEYNNPLPRWWLNMFYLTIAWGFLYLIAYPGLGAFKGLLGWSQTGQYATEVAAADAKYAPLFAKFAGMDLALVAQDSEAQKIGGRLFAAYCTTCHGSDGGGARGFPSLRDGDWLWGGEPAMVKTSILDGRQAAMPAWGAIMGADGVQQVTAYVETLSGRKTDAAAAAQGQQAYQTNCAACHGADGKGNPLMGAPNLTDDIWLYGGSTAKIAESIDKGRNGIMPAQGELLGEDKVHLLAAYVLSLGGGGTPAR
jgi:cytochrome c oxidase cbb3-type subunit III